MGNKEVFSVQEFFTLHIKRQDSPEGQHYWEDFKIPYRPNMNVVSSLMEIQRNPVMRKEKRLTLWFGNAIVLKKSAVLVL